MANRRWIQRNGKLVEITNSHPTQRKVQLMIFKPYKSIIDGRQIDSRKELLLHNKEHGVVDVGPNEQSLRGTRTPTNKPIFTREDHERAYAEQLKA